MDSTLDADSSHEFLEIIDALTAYPHEATWFEFKTSLADPQKIGQYISGLANSTKLASQEKGYLVWGIDDKTHEVIGTTFDARSAKKANQNLEPWLASQLEPTPGFTFHHLNIEGKKVTLLTVTAASYVPVTFNQVPYIRLSTNLTKLNNHPEVAKNLYRLLDGVTFEHQTAISGLAFEEVLEHLDTDSYIELLGLPELTPPVLENYLTSDKLIRLENDGLFSITNLGAILFAKKIGRYDSIQRKAVRVIKYSGNNKVYAEREQIGTFGYATGFAGLTSYISTLLPMNEHIQSAFRTSASIYPEVAIREILANAIIHQDFSVSGSGPMVEIYSNRIEVTNPGVPLIDPDRFVDAPPRSRNELIATMMRRCNICEERGSGWDRIASEIELYQLPAPSIRVAEGHTVVTLYAPKKLEEMEVEERIRAVYLHACLKYVSSEDTSNKTIRDRFGLTDKQSSKASAMLKEAVEAGMITPKDPSAGKRHMKYIPAWAKSSHEFAGSVSH